MLVKNLEHQHWDAVKKIYELGISTKTATFATEIPTWAEWDAKHLPHARLICEVDNRVGAWVALHNVENEFSGTGVAEISIYAHPACKGMGLGFVLMEHVIRQSEENGIWTIQAQIIEENKSTIRLHEKSGFRRVGFRERIGAVDGVWHNVVLFERRSKSVGR